MDQGDARGSADMVDRQAAKQSFDNISPAESAESPQHSPNRPLRRNQSRMLSWLADRIPLKLLDETQSDNIPLNLRPSTQRWL